VTAAEIAAALGGAYGSGAWWRCGCIAERLLTPQHWSSDTGETA
jgi:hypothetical protein